MGHYDNCREGYCAACGAAPGNIIDGKCEFCSCSIETQALIQPMLLFKEVQKLLRRIEPITKDGWRFRVTRYQPIGRIKNPEIRDFWRLDVSYLSFKLPKGVKLYLDLQIRVGLFTGESSGVVDLAVRLNIPGEDSTKEILIFDRRLSAKEVSATSKRGLKTGILAHKQYIDMALKDSSVKTSLPTTVQETESFGNFSVQPMMAVFMLAGSDSLNVKTGKYSYLRILEGGLVEKKRVKGDTVVTLAGSVGSALENRMQKARMRLDQLVKGI